ncbi:MAG: hypothetical protein QM640_00605 [Niabella sp.]
MKIYAQTPAVNPHNNYRQKTIPVMAGRGFFLDTLSIIPSSFKVEGIDSIRYSLDYVNAVLYWKIPPADSNVRISYRVFPFRLNTAVQRMRFDSLLLYSAAPIPPRIAEKGGARGLFNFGNINAQGSFGRQVGFGNSQDVVLNSSLNIQLSGMLADSIELQAAITDNNLSIQPDGNTQQLNEFDEVYIRFKKKNWQLNIGDMDLREDRSYFLKFYKRLQGISFQTTNNIAGNVQSNTLVSGSVAKGKFTRNVFQGSEGNQGPYKLTGANNETNFTILANTERVFIDGTLLQRGEDQDYVIDYNTAEITFTPKNMITKDSRIQVEFEYSDRNYLNINIYAMQQFDFGNRLKLRVGYFGNADAKNATINQSLDARQKQFLYELGDSVQNAYYPSATLDSLTSADILYEKVYTTNESVTDSFYRYSTDAEKAKYNLSFTNVGDGNGNYEPDDSNNANGKVYVYVAPVDGVKQGSYDPVILLIAPKKQQLLTLGIDYNISKNATLKTEVAASNYDVNTFSSLSDGDNKGYAAKVNFSNSKILNARNQLKFITTLGYEYVQKKFQPIERIRDVEFTRDWGLPTTTDNATEKIFRAGAVLKNEKDNGIEYAFTSYNRSDGYNGFQNALLHKGNWETWALSNQFTITDYKTLTDKGYYLKPVIDISKKLPWLDNWVIGANYTLEENGSRNINTDTLNTTSFLFDTYTAYLKSKSNATNKYAVNFYTRSDKYPVGKDFVRGDRSYNLNVQAEILSNSQRQLRINSTFRKLDVYNEAISAETADNSILTRAEYQMNEWKGALTGNVLYEIGSGQEQKRAFYYAEVTAGNGLYTWIDYNEDGVQQLNEFELAAFADQGKYIRVYTSTNEYIKADYTTLNYNVNFTPKLFWRNPASFKKLISRFILTSSLQISKKSEASGGFEFNPFAYGLNDTDLITLTTVFANTLSFNRQSTRWGIDVSNLRNKSRSFLTYGYETRLNDEWAVKYRHFLSRSLTLNINALTGENSLYSDANTFENNNYKIQRNNAESLLSYIRGTSFRITGGYKYEVKNNALVYGGQKAVSNALSLETKYNILQSASLTGKFTFNNLKYNASDAASETTVSYIMLDGLSAGKNFLWNMTLTKRLFNNLELNFQYDGRKPGTSKTVHTGKASLTALF